MPANAENNQPRTTPAPAWSLTLPAWAQPPRGQAQGDRRGLSLAAAARRLGLRRARAEHSRPS